MVKKNELVKQEGGTELMTQAVASELFNSNNNQMEGVTFRTLKIMRESAQFEIAEDEYAKTLVGHILFRHNANQWWPIAFDDRTPEDSPFPACYSLDGKMPSAEGGEVQSDFCATCPRNEYGSDDNGTGKACRNTMRLLFLQDNTCIPVVVVAPPTSLSKKGPLQDWINRVPNEVSAVYTPLGIKDSAGRPIVAYWLAHVELALEKVKCKSDMEASILKVKTLDIPAPNTAENVERIKQLSQIVNDAIEAYKAEMDVHVVNDQTATSDSPESYGDAGGVDPVESAPQSPSEPEQQETVTDDIPI